jgi:hypothetical protein
LKSVVPSTEFGSRPSSSGSSCGRTSPLGAAEPWPDGAAEGEADGTTTEASSDELDADDGDAAADPLGLGVAVAPHAATETRARRIAASGATGFTGSSRLGRRLAAAPIIPP